jgi:uncharacterized iron-regulated membrane protein
MSTRKLLTRLHLILGLGTGLLFFVIALSGAIYTWEPEFSRIAYNQAVKAQEKPFVSITDVRNSLEKAFPEGDFRTALYRDPESSIEVLLYAPGTYYLAQLNPYSAELIHLQDMNKGWINYVKKLHRNLLLGEWGREIVHWVTLLAIPLLVSGLVIWWPATGRLTKDRFLLKATGSAKKRNYDLHSVLGLYASWILVFALITGIYWGFSPVKETIKQLSGENAIAWETPRSKAAAVQPDNDAVLNQLIADYRSTFPRAEVRIGIPHAEDEAIHLSVIDPGKGLNAIDHYYHDQYSGERILGKFQASLSSELSTFNVINGLVYEIHFGSILGLTGRILVCLAALIAASLPITGLLIWLGKRKPRRT